MDVVPYLFPLVTEDSVPVLFEVTSNQITQKSVKFNAAMLWSRQAAAT